MMSGNIETETLREKQNRFAEMLGRLLYFIHRSGYAVSFGEAFRCMGCKHGKDWSLHRLRLAIDLNLFIGGEYQASTESHRPIGEYWESIGGTWGGRFGDGNHYSIEHDGRK